MDKLNIWAIKALGKDVNVDDDVYLSLSELADQFLPLFGWSLAVDAHGVIPSLNVFFADVLCMSDVDGINDTLLALGKCQIRIQKLGREPRNLA